MVVMTGVMLGVMVAALGSREVTTALLADAAAEGVEMRAVAQDWAQAARDEEVLIVAVALSEIAMVLADHNGSGRRSAVAVAGVVAVALFRQCTLGRDGEHLRWHCRTPSPDRQCSAGRTDPPWSQCLH